ncbi:MAG: Y-family DNA polymerase [Gemmatimonadales bacterium]
MLLADADAFYVSVARLVDPAGAGRARLLIVGGSAEGRGVVMSASYEARAYGVHSAMPMARALRLCPEAVIVPVPWEACAAKGREIRGLLERFAPIVQQASSDEFYLDLSGTERLYHGEPLADTARRIRGAVLAETALSLSVGGGASRLVAKLAAGVAKPGPGRAGDGVYVVPSGAEGEFLRRFALADLPGIGPKTAARLRRLGLRTVDDVLPLDPGALAARLGAGLGRAAEWLYRLVRGIDDTRVTPRDSAKSISRDETFARDLVADDDLVRELAVLVERATSDLRNAGLLARTVAVKLRDWDFTTRQARRTLAEPVLSDRAVYAAARALLARLRATRRVPARLLGVALSGLVYPASGPQLELWAGADRGGIETERDRTIARVVDTVRDRFGPAALRRGRP